ncbi:MAG: ATP-binding cassette domain-containing protein [Ruminococcaceae bacterium]|nr:ATP-binding cassette domain-containing protein [Oscillospiraceae bacterium]
MLKFENVRYTAPDGETDIIKDLSLEVKDGEILVITGPNGGGKSTLARLAMGIIKPTEGKITLDGVDISDLDITERAKLGLGYAFQAPPRFKGLTVKRLLSLAAGGDISDNECCKYLSRVGLCAADYLDRALDATLSGGELKRIEVASLLIRNLKVAIYDEPEAGIDIWSFNMLVNAFSTLGKERSGSLMIISHQERVMQTADRIAIIAEGKLKDIGAKDEIMPKLTEIFCRECIKTRN